MFLDQVKTDENENKPIDSFTFEDNETPNEISDESNDEEEDNS